MNRALAVLQPAAPSSAMAYCHTGPHTLSPHLHPTGRRVRRGEFVGLNVFPVIWGYLMELERTFAFGTPTPEQQRALQAVNRAFEAAKAAVRPGAPMGEIDRLTRRILDEQGYGGYIIHGTGHAHGIMVGSAGREEWGELRVYNARELQAGMVTSVEPGVYVPGLGGVRHSDVFVVTP
jgi:Xaa-Pro aminopeptidase